MSNYKQHPASFRDPAGFIFEHNGKFYRQINKSYGEDYALFRKSGLYNLLVKEKKILAHEEVDNNFTESPQWLATILPEQVRFISYPYEWCFSQWKDAALLTLDLVKKAIDHGMILKDATPFNIQFVNGHPVLIDSLSFEKYDASKPWIAYRQFIECFVGPLLLAKYNSAELLKLFQIYPDGIPLNIISKLLPLKSLLNANIFLHVRMPGMIKSKNYLPQKKQAPFSQQKLSSIISNLSSFVQSLSLLSSVTKWDNYYEQTILSKEYAATKLTIVESWLKELSGQSVLDIGTNTGLFAKAAAAAGKFIIAVDADTACIDKLYIECRQNNTSNILPLCIDITNPTPAIGWDNNERSSFAKRAHADITMALALVHHLVFGKNIGFKQMALTFSMFSADLIIEFVPKADIKVQQLLASRPDIFPWYTQENFENVFADYFEILNKTEVAGTLRLLYFMKSKTRNLSPD